MEVKAAGKTPWQEYEGEDDMDSALDVTFAVLAILFSIWSVFVLRKFIQFRNMAKESVLSWELPRPWYYKLCLGMGLVMVFLAVMSAVAFLQPPLPVISQSLMAIFYTVVFPLMFKIRRGFYTGGIWAESGFVAYKDIRWLGWKEDPRLTLAMRADGRFGQKYAFLRVPSDRFGHARRILADRIEGDSLSVETSVLGLDAGVPVQERV
jgi:hypothetical protein